MYYIYVFPYFVWLVSSLILPCIQLHLYIDKVGVICISVQCNPKFLCSFDCASVFNVVAFSLRMDTYSIQQSLLIS